MLVTRNQRQMRSYGVCVCVCLSMCACVHACCDACAEVRGQPLGVWRLNSGYWTWQKVPWPSEPSQASSFHFLCLEVIFRTRNPRSLITWDLHGQQGPLRATFRSDDTLRYYGLQPSRMSWPLASRQHFARREIPNTLFAFKPLPLITLSLKLIPPSVGLWRRNPLPFMGMWIWKHASLWMPLICLSVCSDSLTIKLQLMN